MPRLIGWPGYQAESKKTANTFVAAFRAAKTAVSNVIAFNRAPVALAAAA